MKANELMIGDWVKEPNGENSKVVAIYTDEVELPFNFIVKEKSIKPVQLTTNILVINGWNHYDSNESNGTMERCFLDGLGYAYIFSDGNMEFEIQGIMRGGKGRLRIEISYVHELQHALRLIGMNDLADNFKVA